MKTLYIDCAMGITSSTLFAALYELLDTDKQNEFLAIMNQLFAPDISFHPESRKQCNITGTYMHVRTFGSEEDSSNFKQKAVSPTAKMSVDEITTGHIRTRGLSSDSTEESTEDELQTQTKSSQNASLIRCSYASIQQKIKSLPIPEDVRSNAENIYHILCSSEALIQNTSLEQINLQESGTLKTLANVIGNCLLLSLLQFEQIIASPVHLGNGIAQTTNGSIPIPRPTTTEILKGIPCYTGSIDAELCSPTGAAILKHFVTGFGPMPTMSITKSGFGVGLKEYELPNGLRVFWGETDYLSLYQTHALTEKGEALSQKETILELVCTIDDMNNEELTFAIDTLSSAGAFDVFYTHINLKNNQTGVRLHCLCQFEDKNRFTELLFKYTSSNAIQYQMYSQLKLDTTIEEIHTNYGTIRKNVSTGYGVRKSKYEFDDLKHVAANEGVSIKELLQQLSSLQS